jgi:SAM-dependent methyltransferase
MSKLHDADWDRFWNPQRSEKFSKLSWSKRRVLSVLGPYVSEGKKALDAGCGSGFFSKYFCDIGMETISLDYSDNALKKVKQMTANRVKIVKGDLMADSLDVLLQDRFSLIFSDGLFEHFSNDEQDKILQNLLSVLDDGGVVITVVPNRWSPWQCIRPFFMPGIKEKPFTLKELCILHERNGLKVDACGGVNVFPFKASPEKLLARTFGMLLYTVATKNN